MDKIIRFMQGAWFPIAIIVFLSLFFGKIALNGVEHSKYVRSFKAECESKGGVMHVPKGVRGWAVPECRDPAYVIKINVEH